MLCRKEAMGVAVVVVEVMVEVIMVPGVMVVAMVMRTCASIKSVPSLTPIVIKTKTVARA